MTDSTLNWFHYSGAMLFGAHCNVDNYVVPLSNEVHTEGLILLSMLKLSDSVDNFGWRVFESAACALPSPMEKWPFDFFQR